MPATANQPAMPDHHPEVNGVSSSSLHGFSLDRLGWLCDAFRRQSGIECRLEIRAEHAYLDPAAAEVLYRTIRELFGLYKRAQTRRIVVASESREDGSVAFHVSFDLEGAAPRSSPLECDAVALWDIDQRLREVGAYLELRAAGVCTSAVFPERLFIVR